LIGALHLDPAAADCCRVAASAQASEADAAAARRESPVARGASRRVIDAGA
jgi:hypothetical protein